jgi:uncharacterized protein (DUF58 family)
VSQDATATGLFARVRAYARAHREAGRAGWAHPTRRLAALAALAAPVWLLSWWPWGTWVATSVVLALVVAVLVDLVLLPTVGQFTVEREATTTAGLGDPIDAQYVVHADWRPTRVRLFDQLPAAVEREGAMPLVPVADERMGGTASERTVPVRLFGRERGVHALGPVALEVEGPLGLMRAVVRWPMDDVLTVAPSIAGVRRYRLLALQHRLTDLGVRSIRRRGEGTTFSAMREYVPGDDPRRIDWKATARRQSVIVREHTIEQGQTILIAVDAGRLMTQLAGDLPRFEHALQAALVLADVALHSGDRVGLMLFDDAVRAFVPPARGAETLSRLREALIPARASLVEPDYAAAFRTLAARHRRRSLVVLFTDVIDPRSSGALVAHTTRSAGRHLPVVVALRNDALVAAASPADRRTTSALYESAAAEELLSAREEALQQMRRAGVDVVDASPTQLSAAVVNRYLEIKARGVL